ncbi:hypothetical protein ACIP5L_30095 [Streptomyces bacillaris]|uniref:DUF7224 domain-containing protein n=1 Tax=Streptomyces bacillaris TaxID=68179 RepID=UPI003809121F
MRLKTLLRTGSAGWISAAVVAGLLFFGFGNRGEAVPYWESISAQSTIVLAVISAVCGAGAAWESARLRESDVFTLAPSRTDLRIIGERLAPISVVGLLAIFFSLFIFSPGDISDIPGWPNAGVLASAYAVVLAHISVGYLIGRRLSRLIGPALMLVGGYFWGFWPAALADPSWLRHLNGQGIGDCCHIDRVPSAMSLAATTIFSSGLILAGLIAVALRHRAMTRRVLVVSVSLSGLVGAIVIAAPLGFTGDQARDRSLLWCTGDQPQVCLWPEQRARADDFVRWSHEAGRELRTVGLEPAESIEFTMVSADRDSVLAAVATSGFNFDPPVCAQKPYADYPGYEASPVTYLWLALVAGAEPNSLAWSKETVELAQQVREMPEVSQKQWFDRNMRSVRDCSVKPELSPGSYISPGQGSS